MEEILNIQNGRLTLDRNGVGLKSLALFFEIIIQKDEFVISRVTEETTADQFALLRGETLDWGSDLTQVEILYSKVGGQLISIRFIKPLADLAALTFPGISFLNLTNEYYHLFPEDQKAISPFWHEIKGQLQLGDSLILPFKIANPSGSGAYLVKTEFPSQSAPDLTDLATLFGNEDDPEKDLAWLPDNLRDTKLLTLRDLRLKIDSAAAVKLVLIGVTVDLLRGHRWPIVPGVSSLSVGDLWFDLEVDYPLEADYRFPLFTIGGTIQIGAAGTDDGLIDLTARWPDWAISGELRKGSQIKLGQLLEGLTLPAGQLPRDNDALLIRQLHFSAEPTTDPKEFSFFILIDNVWKLRLAQDATFEIEELSLGLSYTGKSETSPSGLTGQFIGKFALSQVELSLTAAYNGASAGWTFSGATGPGQQIPLGRLIADDIAPKFGGLQAPAPIAGLVIENLSTSFNTSSKDFTFAGETVLPLAAEGEDRVDFTLKIELKNQTDGGYRKQFAGALKLKGLEFDVIFAIERQVTSVGEQPQPQNEQTFLAIFQNQLGAAIPVDELVKPLGLNNIQTGLSFTLKEVLLAYQRTSESTEAAAGVPSVANGKWLFGIDIEGGLNLSAIHIDDLPFVNIPPDQTLKLDFQVLIASEHFTQEEVRALSGLAPNGNFGFPTKAIGLADLSITLDLGTDRKQIDLPIGLKTQATVDPTGPPAESGLVPADQANASTAQNGSGVALTGDDGVRWITLQKQLGPLAFERIGVKYADNQVEAQLDAAFSAGGLTIALQGLSVRSPINEFKPEFGLTGLGIDFKNASVEIGGTFLKEPNGFAGLAVIRTEVLSLSAIGAYAYADGQPSLFIYAVLDYPFGGPAFFYVTGIAAGFGYNRRLLMPGIEQVASFPLVLEATRNTPTALPSGQLERSTALQREIQSLEQYIPIENGQYFLAVGLKFTSFKQIDSFALLVVQFGNRFEIDLLGLSTLQVPSAAAGGNEVTPVAVAQLALKAVFIPSEGFLGVRAQLTSNSFILSRACHLTGGFAFYTWFSGRHEGDFVLTLGGYHPSFQVPEHYPQVPRLGFAWQVSPQFYLRGGLYFALTANALMAGGCLDALFQTSHVTAWFRAGADFLLAWKPYHYEVEVFVSMGLDITFQFFGTRHISLSASANLKLWGPEFGGEAHIRVKVLSFTVPVDIAFGSRAPAIPAIGFEEFKKTYLPAEEDQLCSITIRSGLIETVTENGEEIWVVNSKELVLVTNAAVPSTRGRLFGTEVDWDGGRIAVQPMGVREDEITTTHEVSIEGLAGDHFALSPVAKKMPAALWGQPEPAANQPFRHSGDQRYVEKPQLNGPRFVEDTLAGYEIRVAQRPAAGATHPISKEILRSDRIAAPRGPAWEEFKLEDPVGRAAWQAAANSTRLVRNSDRDDLMAALDLAQAEVDFGEPVLEL